MKTLFIIPLVLMSMLSFPSWGSSIDDLTKQEGLWYKNSNVAPFTSEVDEGVKRGSFKNGKIVTSWAASVDSARVTIKNILSLFPVCELPSSLGQRCKYDFEETLPLDFIEACCPNGHEISVTEKSLEVFSADGWLYRFDLSYLSDNITKIRFEDKALNGGTYHTVSKFFAQIEDDKLNLWNYTTTRY